MKTKPKKYTEEWIVEELTSMIKEAQEKNYLYIGQLFTSRNYLRNRLSEWTKQYPNNDRIRTLYGKLHNFFETQLVVKGLNRETDSGITKFCLINNYDWKDKQVITGEEDEPLSISITVPGKQQGGNGKE